MQMTEQNDANLPSTDSQQSNESIDDVKTSDNNSSNNRILAVWNHATSRLMQLLPVEQVAQTLVKQLSVSEAQVAEILQTVRTELPTTEALLIGKPQAGKVQSSGD